MTDKEIQSVVDNRYQKIFELSPEAIILLDRTGKIIDVNNRLYDWLGYRPRDIIGRNVRSVSFLTSASKVMMLKKFSLRMLGNDVSPYDLFFVDKKGNEHIGQISSALIRNKSGKIISDLVMISEVTKQRQMEGDLKKFQLAVEGASDHIIITDPDGKILFANKAVEKITGFSRKKIIGQKAGSKLNWGGTMENAFYDRMWKTMKTKKVPFEAEIRNRKKNGEEYDAVASISPVLNKKDEVLFFVGMERDITKEKEVDRAKTEFVSLASHQLRTPLSTINWYSEMLLDGDVGKLNKGQREYLKEVYKGNQRMVDLVNALLNVSRLELGTFAIDPEKTKIFDIAKSVINEMKPQIEAKKIKFTRKFDKSIPEMMLDIKLIRMVFQNILSNAIKYTPEKGKVIVYIHQNKNKKVLEIAVSDTGMGIPKHQQDKIFTKLFRADNVKEQDTEGTGLGLYIVKSIIDHSGGKIWFESEEGKGTTFYVTLPFKGMKKKEGTKELS
ncbi:PAS domain S-box protein [Patescibacteria group bacterium]|nr:PAS domain S-box protein [Patescibacteria group bacterium]